MPAKLTTSCPMAKRRRRRQSGVVPRVVRSQVRLSAPRHRSVKPGPAGHRRWRLTGLTDRRRRAARSAHAINAGMSITAPITRGGSSPAAPCAQVGPAASHSAASETHSATGPVPDILENPLPPSTVGAHLDAGKKVRISTGAHTAPITRSRNAGPSKPPPRQCRCARQPC